MTTTMPKTVEPLDPSKLLRGPYDDPSKPGCGCLAFHAVNAFPSAARSRFHKAMTQATGTEDWMWEYNERTPTAKQVETFHKALVLTGYIRRGNKFVLAPKPRTRKGKA